MQPGVRRKAQRTYWKRLINFYKSHRNCECVLEQKFAENQRELLQIDDDYITAEISYLKKHLEDCLKAIKRERRRQPPQPHPEEMSDGFFEAYHTKYLDCKKPKRRYEPSSAIIPGDSPTRIDLLVSKAEELQELFTQYERVDISKNVKSQIERILASLSATSEKTISSPDTESKHTTVQDLHTDDVLTLLGPSAVITNPPKAEALPSPSLFGNPESQQPLWPQNTIPSQQGPYPNVQTSDRNKHNVIEAARSNLSPPSGPPMDSTVHSQYVVSTQNDACNIEHVVLEDPSAHTAQIGIPPSKYYEDAPLPSHYPFSLCSHGDPFLPQICGTETAWTE